MSNAWRRLGLRGRLAFSIGTIVLAICAVLFVAVRHEMNDLSTVIMREEAEEGGPSSGGARESSAEHLAPIEDVQDDTERTFLIATVLTLGAALLLGYVVAARTAAPLRRLARTAAAVDAGDLTPRTDADPSAVAEVRVLAEAFDHMLDRLDEAFSRQRRFVSDASHELRTPLTAIRGQLEVLGRSEQIDPDEVRHVERTVLTEMTRIERLVDDLLALARLDEGVPLEREEIPVDSFLRRLAEADPGEITVGELPTGSFEGDPDRLAQAIRNLLGNARRHSGPGGLVAIGAGAEQGSLTIWVDDDGPGIPAAEREEIFGRFYRSEDARDRHSGGSGLGLAITRAIVEAHGGRIWATESPLGGARVAFELPGFLARDRQPATSRR
jgi:two-component system, OmpR family, sensor kinase